MGLILAPNAREVVEPRTTVGGKALSVVEEHPFDDVGFGALPHPVAPWWARSR